MNDLRSPARQCASRGGIAARSGWQPKTVICNIGNGWLHCSVGSAGLACHPRTSSLGVHCILWINRQLIRSCPHQPFLLSIAQWVLVLFPLSMDSGPKDQIGSPNSDYWLCVLTQPYGVLTPCAGCMSRGVTYKHIPDSNWIWDTSSPHTQTTNTENTSWNSDEVSDVCQEVQVVLHASLKGPPLKTFL